MDIIAVNTFETEYVAMSRCGATVSFTLVTRAPSRSRKLLRLAYDSLRLASRLAVVVSTAAAQAMAAYGGLVNGLHYWLPYSYMLATPLTLLICNI